MVEGKKDYTEFDRFIKAKMKEGTLFIGMKESRLKEVLRQLGLHRVKIQGRDGRDYVVNEYPKPKQLDHVKSVMAREKQVKIDKSMFYVREKSGKGYHYRAKEIIYYKNKVYRRGQFIPKRYIDE